MKKICVLYNFAQHYRTRIFQLLDQEFECSFFFGKSYLDIKKMDYSIFKGDVHEVKTIKIGPIIYRTGLIKQLFKKYDAYIILGESRVVSTWLFLLISRLLPHKKVYSWTHGWYGKERGIIKILNKLLLRLPSGGNFFYGNYGRELAIKEGLKPNKQYVIHNSLAYEDQMSIRNSLQESDIYSQHFQNDNFNIIFIGRLTSSKRLDLLIDSLNILRGKGILLNFTIVGEGASHNALKIYAEEKDLYNNIWFYGACYDEERNAELIYNADICVSPGNVGLTAIHAMTFGTPVITHNKFTYQGPEFEAITEGETGAFFEYNNAISLAETIEKWLSENRHNRNEIRDACYKEIDCFWTPQFQIEVFRKNLKL